MSMSSNLLKEAPTMELSEVARGALAEEAFRGAHPFPLAIIDNFLPQDFADKLHQEILNLQDLTQSNDYIFAKNKFEYPALQEIGPHGAELKRFLLSEEFAEALSAMYGRPVFVDTEFTGGGVHRGGPGSFLDMHADFGRHPSEKHWVRELNILLYMNKDWQPGYRGSLDLTNADNGQSISIEPLFNRCVIMLTKKHTLHGYKATAFPPGTHRNSIAAYAYSLEGDEAKLAELSTTTNWRPVDANPAKRVMARLAPSVVRLKQRLFGSNTVKNSGRK